MGLFEHGWSMMAGMFLFWILVLGAAFWLLAQVFPAARAPRTEAHDGAPTRADPAVQMVRRRYASGEITKSEYEETLQTLERATGGNSPQQI